jgi:hypothetical protein
MKTLNFDIFGQYELTVEEMIYVRGGDMGDGEPVPVPSQPPFKV